VLYIVLDVCDVSALVNEFSAAVVTWMQVFTDVAVDVLCSAPYQACCEAGCIVVSGS